MLYDYEPEWRPEGIVDLERSDLLAWKRPGWPSGYSRVAYAKWTDDEADRRIDEVLAFFGDTPFNWHVGPSSAPADLEARLLRHDMSVAERPRMMTAELPLTGMRLNAEVRIVDVRDKDTLRIFLERVQPSAEERERAFPERLAFLDHPGRRTGYLLAFSGDTAVANATYRFSSDGRCMYLTGGETSEAHRGRGIYQTLVTHRATLAAERGCDIVSILANRNTSAPVLVRHGFRDHGELPRFVRREARAP